MSLFNRVLLFAVLCLFLGRGYEYFFWGSPIRVLVWDEALFGPVVENVFGQHWEAFVANLNVDRALSTITRFIGGYFLLCGLAAILYFKSRQPIWAWILRIGSVILLFHALLETKDHFYHVAQFFEYAIQISVPLFLIASLASNMRPSHLLLYCKIAIALTFVAHGLYAIGAYPVPGHFVDMTINLLGCTEAVARDFLFTVGILDLVAAVLLFVPAWQKAGFYYTIFWGSVTAFARVASGFDIAFPADSLHGSLYQTVYRLPHGLLPIAGLLLCNWLAKNQKPVENDGGLPAEPPAG